MDFLIKGNHGDGDFDSFLNLRPLYDPKQPLEDTDGLKLEGNHHPSDDDVRQMLSERLKGELKLVCMSDLPKNERNEILLSVLQKGAGIRQLGRITGIGFKFIQKLATKKESKSPSP